jgi:hypothetical protein
VDLPITAVETQQDPILKSRMINPGALPLQARKNVQELIVGPTGQGTHLSRVSTEVRQLDLIQQQLNLEKALVEGLGLHNTRDTAAQQQQQPTPLQGPPHDVRSSVVLQRPMPPPPGVSRRMASPA